MPSQCPHPDMTLGVQNAWSLANRQSQYTRGPSGNSQLPTPKRRLFIPLGKRDSSEGGSFYTYTIEGQNSAPLFSLNNSHVADITQCMASTTSTMQRWSTNTPTTTLDTSSRSPPASRVTSGTGSMRRIVSSPGSGIPSTPTVPTGHDNLPTPILNQEGCTIITNTLQMRATARFQSQRQWQPQLQVASTPHLAVSGSRSIHRFGHSDMTHLAFSTGILLELCMWDRRPFPSGSDLGRVSYATGCVAKPVAQAPNWQVIEMYWNTAM
jgi:hypothetical protein